MFPGGIGEEKNDGDYPNGGHGPLNSTIGADNVPCLASMYGGQPTGPGIHVHAFVGIYYNGAEVALPDGIGFADPSADGTFFGINNWTEYASHCYYQMHTHDASGMIHIEGYTAPAGGAKGSLYTLGDFLAVWGIPLNSMQLGPLNGPVTIYTSGPVARGGYGTNSEVGSNTYTVFTGLDPNTIPLYSHEVVWILIGSGNPTGSSLPNVLFFTEY